MALMGKSSGTAAALGLGGTPIPGGLPRQVSGPAQVIGNHEIGLGENVGIGGGSALHNGGGGSQAMRTAPMDIANFDQQDFKKAAPLQFGNMASDPALSSIYNTSGGSRIPQGFGNQNISDRGRTGMMGYQQNGMVDPYFSGGREAIQGAVMPPQIYKSQDTGVRPGMRPDLNAVQVARQGYGSFSDTDPRHAVLAAYNPTGPAQGNQVYQGPPRTGYSENGAMYAGPAWSSPLGAQDPKFAGQVPQGPQGVPGSSPAMTAPPPPPHPTTQMKWDPAKAKAQA